jgi:hypothetical protein
MEKPPTMRAFVVCSCRYSPRYVTPLTTVETAPEYALLVPAYIVALSEDHWFPAPLAPSTPVKAQYAYSPVQTVDLDATYASLLTVHASAVMAAGGKRVDVAAR